MPLLADMGHHVNRFTSLSNIINITALRDVFLRYCECILTTAIFKNQMSNRYCDASVCNSSCSFLFSVLCVGCYLVDLFFSFILASVNKHGVEIFNMFDQIYRKTSMFGIPHRKANVEYYGRKYTTLSAPFECSFERES